MNYLLCFELALTMHLSKKQKQNKKLIDEN